MSETVCFPTWIVVLVIGAVFYGAGWLVGRFPLRKP